MLEILFAGRVLFPSGEHGGAEDRQRCRAHSRPLHRQNVQRRHRGGGAHEKNDAARIRSLRQRSFFSEAAPEPAHASGDLAAIAVRA